MSEEFSADKILHPIEFPIPVLMTKNERLRLLKPTSRRVYELLQDGAWHGSADIQRLCWVQEYRKRISEIRDIMGVEVISENSNVGGHWYPGYRIRGAT